MGRNKLLLEVGGERIVDRVASALDERCDELIFCGSGTAPPGARVVEDARPGLGPLAGIEAGLAAADYPLVFVAAGDMPFLETALVDHLLGVLEFRGALAAVPEAGGRTHPLCAAYARDALPELRSALDDGVRAAREFVRGLETVAYVPGDEIRSVGDPEVLLMNVNSPRDLRRARELVDA